VTPRAERGASGDLLIGSWGRSVAIEFQAAKIARSPDREIIDSALLPSLRRPGSARALRRSLFQCLGSFIGLFGTGRPRRSRRFARRFLGLALAFGARGLLLAAGLATASGGSPRPIGQRLLARRFLLGFELVVDELEDGRLSGVSPPRAEPEDPRISSGPVDEPR